MRVDSTRKMEAEFELKWRVGARTAKQIVDTAARFASTIEIIFRNKRGNAKDIMDVLSLGYTPPVDEGNKSKGGDLQAGAHIVVAINGPDADAAMREFTELFTCGIRQDRCPFEGCPSTPIFLERRGRGIEYACSKGHLWAVDASDPAGKALFKWDFSNLFPRPNRDA